MKTINIEIPSGHEIDQENSNLSEGKIVFREIKKGLPKTWEELKRVKGYYVNAPDSGLREINCLTNPINRNVFATEELAKASIAMAQLSQLREVYRQGWKPNWGDNNIKYVIYMYSDKIDKCFRQSSHHFLSFQSAEIRDEFLKNFASLIETAKPLMS